MKYRLARWMTAMTVLAVLAVPSRLAAAPATPHYVAIDVGTLGGPNAYPNEPGRLVTNNGIVVGSAETPALNPFPQECSGCNAADAFEWQNGVMTDLGNVGGYNAGIFEINGAGVGAGFSETGLIDPQTNSPQVHAATSSAGRLTGLGTLGGYESWANGINDQGQVAGFADNTVPDPYAQVMTNWGFAPYPSATQWRAVVWQGGRIKDLGTLGGPDSIGYGLINNRGQVAGESFTNSTANATTGFPTMDPFVWENGKMRDLGSLGGTVGFPNWMNGQGEVVGRSNLAGDGPHHPFLWDGSLLRDLGTLGGPNGAANWINDVGDVVGTADLSGGQVHHGFVWKAGKMADLVPVEGAPCSNATAINDQGLVVGNATDCQGSELAAILWEHGSAYDLNKLVAPSSLDLITAEYINDSGEILCRALLPNGDYRVVLVVPASLAASLGLSVSAAGHSASTVQSGAAVRRRPFDSRDTVAPHYSRMASRYPFRAP